MESLDGTNYVGAAIFWSYIMAALCFNFLVIHTLFAMPAHELRRDKSRRFMQYLLSILATISFATLSFNMLSVLFQSFDEWAVVNYSLESVQGLKKMQPRTRFVVWEFSSVQHIPVSLTQAIWQWSTTSTLFQDFAEAICAEGPQYVVTEAALLMTGFICFYMGVEGELSAITCCGGKVAHAVRSTASDT